MVVLERYVYLSTGDPVLLILGELAFDLSIIQLTASIDNLRQAPFDWRIREEIYCNARRRGPSLGLLNRKPALYHILSLLTRFSEPRSNSIRCLGYCRSREIWRSKRWLLYQWSMRYYHVRCYVSNYVQERSQLAP